MTCLSLHCIDSLSHSDGEDAQDGENGVTAPGKKKKKKKKKPAGAKSGDGQGGRAIFFYQLLKEKNCLIVFFCYLLSFTVP